MANLIRNQKIETDPWQWFEGLGDLEGLGDPGDLKDHKGQGLNPDSIARRGQRIAVPFDLWVRSREVLLASGAAIGVRIEAGARAEDLGSDAELFGLIAVNILKFTDGRMLSLGSLLRDRYGFAGELRAVGDVIVDQLADLRRCGFDAFQLRDDQDPARALRALYPFSEAYQSAADLPRPLFRRRLPA